jgi:hypothetical protein
VIAGLLGAIGYLIRAITSLIRMFNRTLTMEESMSRHTTHSATIKQAATFISVIVIVMSSLVLATTLFTQESPLNVRLTTAAWIAFNNSDFKTAIIKADTCIDEFEPLAIKEQQELQTANTPLPPKGTVSEATRNDIFKRGLLNDVGTCWFIKGRSLEKLKKIPEAIQAYQKCEIYTYARTYDDKAKLFWSPSEAAGARKSSLQEKQVK